MQYNVTLPTTGAIAGTSQTKLYEKLGLQTLKFRRWVRRTCALFKIKTSGLPKYTFELNPQEKLVHNAHSIVYVPTYHCITDLFNISFFSFFNMWMKQA